MKPIEAMFKDINLKQKKCLDIGFGLAGAATHLATKYGANVFGIEINPWMVSEANKKIPPTLKDLLRFVANDDFPKIPFAENEFDIVYSKGVLVHLPDKQETFNEIFRVLKPGGTLVIDDWLSQNDNAWSDRVKKLCEIENLSLFAISEQSYLDVIKRAGFKNTATKNVSQQYSRYNFKIVKRLQDKNISKIFQEKFGEKLGIDSMIECYQLIADAMKNDEIIVMNIRAEKK